MMRLVQSLQGFEESIESNQELVYISKVNCFESILQRLSCCSLRLTFSYTFFSGISSQATGTEISALNFQSSIGFYQTAAGCSVDQGLSRMTLGNLLRLGLRLGLNFDDSSAQGAFDSSTFRLYGTVFYTSLFSSSSFSTIQSRSFFSLVLNGRNFKGRLDPEFQALVAYQFCPILNSFFLLNTDEGGSTGTSSLRSGKGVQGFSAQVLGWRRASFFL